jgi:hypothetical protein
MLLGAILVLLQCTGPAVSDNGGASETVATVAPCQKGVMVSVEGNGAFSVTAEIAHEGYSVVNSSSFHDTITLTNEYPEWKLPLLSESVFTIIVTNKADGKAVCFRYDNRPIDTRLLPVIKTLGPTGSVSGIAQVQSSDGLLAPATGYTVVLKGSRFSTTVDTLGAYTMGGIPEGNYVIEASNGSAKMSNHINGAEVIIKKDETSLFTITVLTN